MKKQSTPYRHGLEALEARIAPAAVVGLDSTNHLINFDSATPGTITSTVTVTGLGAGESLIGIDYRAETGALYGVSVDASHVARVYVIDPTTGDACLSATLHADSSDTTSPYTTLTGTNFAFDFNPATDRLTLVSDTNLNLEVNVDTGTVITNGAPNPGTPTLAGGAYTNNVHTATTTQLYDIDVTSDTLVLQDPTTGALTNVGSLGVDATGVAGFEIHTTLTANGTATNTATAALTVGGTTSLYTINLADGTATVVGAIGTGTTALTGLTQSTGQPSATAIAISDTGHLLKFDTATPNVTTDLGAITGLGAGETIIGADFKTADGTLYVVTKDASNGGHLYTVNTTTAAATTVAALSADPADSTNPYATLSGTSFGVDFNPVSGGLRIVSDTGENLKVNASTGLVTTDPNLSGATSALGAAYSNNFVNATTTTLYDIDYTTDKLYTQDLTTGALTEVGSLNVDATALGGFDIKSSTEAYATLTVGGVTSLYSVNLSTGAATAVGEVGAGTAGTLGLSVIPAGTLQFNPTTVTVAEDAGNAVVTVERVGGTEGTVSAIVNTSNGTATAGSDYTATCRVVTFAPGETSKTISIPIIDDSTQEPTENFLATVTDVFGGASLNTNHNVATVNITDNDGPLVTISDVTKAEGNTGTTTFNFVVHLSTASATDVTVDYTTANGTATSGSDYVAATGTVTIPAGQLTATIPVSVNGDTTVEPNETFSVVLSNPSAGATLSDSTAIGTILNDDGLVTGGGKSITFTDVDGDLVTIKVTKGTLDATNLVLEPAGTLGGAQLLTLDLTAAEFAKANVSITAKRGPAGGDGYVNVGYIDATGNTLGVVSVDGDLGQIDAGSVTRLAVHSIGLLGLSTQGAGGSLVSNITGSLGTLAVATDFNEAELIVNGNIGPVFIGGDIVGGSADYSGSIEAGGKLTNVNVFGSIVGGTGLESGSLIAKTAGPIKVRGDIDEGSILIAGNANPTKTKDANALTLLLVGGDLENANVLIGYDRTGNAVNGDVQAGPIIVLGDAVASNIAAGIDAGVDGDFGTDDDGLVAIGNVGIVAKIASISVRGEVIGTADVTTDHFGIVAEQIGAFSVGSTKFPLSSKTGSPLDRFDVGSTLDVTVREYNTAVI